MTTVVAAPTGSTRVIAVGDLAGLTRGSAAEFRHSGIVLVPRLTSTAALLEVGREPGAIILVSTELTDMALGDFVDVVRSVAKVPLIVGLAPNCEPAALFDLLERGVGSTIPLPVTPERLARAVSSVIQPVPVDEHPRIEVGPLVIDSARYFVSCAGVELPLARRDFEMLRYLASVYPRVATMAELLTEFERGASERSVRIRSSIGRIRNRVHGLYAEAPFRIEIVQRVGYRLTF